MNLGMGQFLDGVKAYVFGHGGESPVAACDPVSVLFISVCPVGATGPQRLVGRQLVDDMIGQSRQGRVVQPRQAFFLPGGLDDERGHVAQVRLAGRQVGGGLAGYVHELQAMYDGARSPKAVYKMWDAFKLKTADQAVHLKRFVMSLGGRHAELVPDEECLVPPPLGDKIRALRKQKKLSLEQLAELTDSSKSYIWELENKDDPKPSADKIGKIAAVLDVTTEFLLTESAATPDEQVLDEAFFRKYKTMSEPDKKKIRKILDAWEDE